MDKLFIPHELKTIEVNTEKMIFRVNGEDFGKGCTGFRITCNRYDSFDIRVEVDTTVHLVSIRNGKCNWETSYTTDVPQFGCNDALVPASDEQAD